MAMAMRNSSMNGGWPVLQRAIKAIQDQNKGGLSFEELYSNAYQIVLNNEGDCLYKKIQDALKDHVTNVVLIKINNGLVNGCFITTLLKSWQDYELSTKTIRDVFLYLDRVYIQKNNHANIYNLGLNLFCENIIRNDIFNDIIRKTILDCVDSDRKEEKFPDKQNAKKLTDLLVKLGVYEEEFEVYFLSNSDIYYQVESQKYLEKNDLTLYIRKFEEFINKEKEIVHQYLDLSTENKILEIVEREFFSNNLRKILELEANGFNYMFDNKNIKDLSLIYQRFRKYDGKQIILEASSNRLRKILNSLVQEKNTKDGVKFVEIILDWKNTIDKFVTEIFENDQVVVKKFRTDFEDCLNINRNFCEYFSLFINNLFKKNLNDQEFDQMLETSFVLFKYIIDKDIFINFYRKHLARRLLYNKISNEDLERKMLLQLKLECGNDSTIKMEKMFQDNSLSETLMDEFKEYLDIEDIHLHGVDLKMKVIQINIWPFQSGEKSCNLPNKLRLGFDVFKTFYGNKYPKRKLTILPQLGTVELNAFFYNPLKKSKLKKEPSEPNKPRKYILSVSTFQMVILLLFNKKSRWTYEEIIGETDIEEQNLVPNLKGLLGTGKYAAILRKLTPNDNLEKNDQFVVNDDFYSKYHRVKVETVTVNKIISEPERKESMEEINKQRKFQIQAAVVRVMKSRQKLTSSELTAEVINILKIRFQPNPQMIKTEIKILVDKEYLAEDKNILTYIA